MDGMVGPSSGGYQGVSQIWAISTGGETYRGDARLAWGSARSYGGSPFLLHNRWEKRSYSYIGIEHVLEKKIYPPL